MLSMLLAGSLSALSPACLPQGGGSGHGGEVRVLMPAATVNNDGTVTLPLHEGRVGSRTFWYVVLDASTSGAADRFGSNRADKLRRARGTMAVQPGHFDGDVLVVDGTVDFGPERLVVPDPVSGFPPLQVRAGSVGDPGYSPLVELPDGAVINAPQLMNDTGRHDKVAAIDTAGRTVRLRLSDGFARDKKVVYVSTDASNETAAALEGATLAPRLDAAPFPGGDGTDSARASLAAFVNGPTGAGNPQRQGLNSALLGEGDPLNVLAWLPGQGRYSPLWDVHLAAWAAGVAPRRMTEFARVEDLAEQGRITAPDGSAFGPSDFIVNCPIVGEVR